MTTWSVSLAATLTAPVENFADVIDDLLSTLEDQASVTGPVTFLNLQDLSFGARFSLQAEDMPSAVNRAIEAFVPSARSVGLTFVLRGGNILVEDAQLVDDPERLMAGV